MLVVRWLMCNFCDRANWFLYQKTNNTSDNKPYLLWEMLKVYTRGQISFYNGYESYSRRKKWSNFASQISHLDNVYANFPTPDIYNKGISLQAVYCIIQQIHPTNCIENLLLSPRATKYELPKSISDPIQIKKQFSFNVLIVLSTVWPSMLSLTQLMSPVWTQHTMKIYMHLLLLKN